GGGSLAGGFQVETGLTCRFPELEASIDGQAEQAGQQEQQNAGADTPEGIDGDTAADEGEHQGLGQVTQGRAGGEGPRAHAGNPGRQVGGQVAAQGQQANQ